jgi:hypothetical protein
MPAPFAQLAHLSAADLRGVSIELAYFQECSGDRGYGVGRWMSRRFSSESQL